ncbi:MAG TPA: hypothetical protein DCK95_03890 [Anaerolineaceae bacterium]|nr:hypothetical protein [Anaerolineaceae bacterium]
MKKFFGIVLSLVIVPLILVSLVTTSVTFWVLDRETTIKSFTSDEFVEQISSNIAFQEIIEGYLGEMGQTESAALSASILAILPEDYFKTQITSMLNQVFDYFEGKAPTLSLQLDLTTVKNELTGPNREEQLRKFAQALPICQVEQMVENNAITICKPDFIDEDDFIEYYLKPTLPILMMFIPNSIVVMEPSDPMGDISNVPPLLQSYIQPGNMKNMVYILIGLTVLLWFLTALIGGKDWRERLLWLGWTLIIPSVAVLVMGALLGSDLGDNLIQLGLEYVNFQSIQNLPLTTQGIAQIMKTAFMKPLQTGSITMGGCATALGIGLIAWGAVTRKKQTTSAS